MQRDRRPARRGRGPAAGALRGRVFEALDANHDGVIDRSEFDDGMPRVMARLRNARRDGGRFGPHTRRRFEQGGFRGAERAPAPQFGNAPRFRNERRLPPAFNQRLGPHRFRQSESPPLFRPRRGASQRGDPQGPQAFDGRRGPPNRDRMGPPADRDGMQGRPPSNEGPRLRGGRGDFRRGGFGWRDEGQPPRRAAERPNRRPRPA